MKKLIKVLFVLLPSILFLFMGCSNKPTEKELGKFLHPTKVTAKGYNFNNLPNQINIRRLYTPATGEDFWVFEINNFGGKSKMFNMIKPFIGWLKSKNYFVYSEMRDYFNSGYKFIGKFTQDGLNYMRSEEDIENGTKYMGEPLSYKVNFLEYDVPKIINREKNNDEIEVTFQDIYKWAEADYVNYLKDDLKNNNIDLPNGEVKTTNVSKKSFK